MVTFAFRDALTTDDAPDGHRTFRIEAHFKRTLWRLFAFAVQFRFVFCHSTAVRVRTISLLLLLLLGLLGWSW